MVERMTLREFRLAVEGSGLSSLPVIEAVFEVLVKGRSQYSVSRAMGVDQGTLSRACRKVREYRVDCLREAIRSMMLVEEMQREELLPSEGNEALKCARRMLEAMLAEQIELVGGEKKG